MRAAVITPYLPWPADTGGKLRSYYLLKGLAERAEVDLYTVCYGTPPATTELEAFCRRVTVLPLYPTPHREQLVRAWLDGRPRSVRYFQDAWSLEVIRAKLISNPYDLLICDEICMATYLDRLHYHHRTPRLIMRQKIDYLHYQETAESRPWGPQRLLDALEAKRLQRFEATMMPKFDGAVVCSAADAQVATQQGPNLDVNIVVNGADVAYFTPQRAPDPKPTVLLLGTMHYQPNIDMVLYFFRTIYPRVRQTLPDLQVFIVGHLPPPEITRLGKLPGVTVTGSVADVRPYMARSWVLAVPLRLGGGTRLKIVEAMAAALPVVSTTVGAEGLPELTAETVALADTPDAFAAALTRLLQDAARRTRQAQAARLIVQHHYSWQALSRKYAAFCDQLAESQSQSQS